MMNLEISIPEIKKMLQELPTNREKFFEMMRFDVRETTSNYLNKLMSMEISLFLGREKHQRQTIAISKRNYLNGGYGRTFTIKGLGKLKIRVPRDRLSKYKTDILPRYEQYDKQIEQDMALMFFGGMSTRTVGMLSEKLLGRKLSHSEVSESTQVLQAAVEKWRTRDLSEYKMKYLILDGTNFNMRVSDSIEKVPVLVAIGVTEDGLYMVLGLQSGDKESATNWREFLKDLKKRGLKTETVVLGIMDGLSGLEKVFTDEFSNANIQRCQVHVARNVISKVPHKLKKTVADELRNIFYASSKKKARSRYDEFIIKWEKEIPTAVKSLRNSIDNCLTFYKMPQEDWISIRTTNVIERLNKEFKRRTKPMEIIANEKSCYALLAFVSLKMELAWRKTRVGKSRGVNQLPWFSEFTQIS